MEVRTLKFISIPIIFIVNYIIGIFPYFLISKRIKRLNRRTSADSADSSEIFFVSSTMKRFLTLANFFCGGVFLATALIGLYPSVNNKFIEIHRKRPSVPDYPFAGLTLIIGFFLVWILEILVHKCIHTKHQSHNHNDMSVETPRKNSSIKNNSTSKNFNSFIPLKPISPLYQNDQTNHPQPSDSLLNADEKGEENELILSESVQVNIESVSHEAHSHVPIKGNLLGSLMLTFALGSHSIIEGLGFAMVGEFSMTLNMLITILIHESVCALSLGVNLASKKTPMVTSLALLATFSILIPVGIAIGLAVNLGLEKNLIGETVSAILQGVAAGTFIYVVFMEILPAEILQRKDSSIKVLLMVIGFSVIAAMKVFHSHTHRSSVIRNCTAFSSTISSMPSVSKA